MKKAIFGLFALVLLGAGCMPAATVEGDWFLAFDLPDGWVMVREYNMGGEAVPVDEGVSREISDIVLQSTSSHIYTSSVELDEEALAMTGEIVADHFTYIRVLKLDDRRVIPSESENMGDGFYKEDMCEGVESCELERADRYRYYFETDTSKYQFLVTQAGQEIEEAEGVILSATEVTVIE